MTPVKVVQCRKKHGKSKKIIVKSSYECIKPSGGDGVGNADGSGKDG